MATEIGCGDNSCIFYCIRTKGGMGTNGGCRCFDPLESWIESEKRWNFAEIGKLRRDVMVLARAHYALKEREKELEKCLSWYVANDDTNETEDNKSWLEGKRKAMKVLGVEDSNADV